MLVVIEGADFTGKSTISAMLTEMLIENGIYPRRCTACLHSGIIQRTAIHLQEKPYANRTLKSLVFHSAYAIDCFMWRDNREILTLQESSLLRVIAYDSIHKRWYGKLALELLRPLWPAAHIEILLHCSFEERVARWHASGTSDPRDRDRFSSSRELTIALEAELRRRCIARGYELIDTEKIKPREAATYILAKIQNLLHGSQ